MPAQNKHNYTEDYIEKCFQVWYSADCPTARHLSEIVPCYADNNRPHSSTLLKWMRDYDWNSRADLMNARAVEIVNNEQIQLKAEVLKRQASEARAIAEKAKKAILEGEFDSSAAAVAAYFRAAEQERVSVGLSDSLLRISRATDEELKGKIRELMSRAAAAGDIIDAEVKDDDTGEAKE